VTPEAALGGPLARVQDGDLVTVDAEVGLLDLHVDRTTLAERPVTGRAPQGPEWTGTGRELFAAFRSTVGSAEDGASVFPGVPVPPQEVSVVNA
jgi:phosphogluconate dehydratase